MKCHVLSCDVMRPLAPPVSASPLSPRVAHVSRPFPAWLSGSFAFRNRKGGPASRLSSTPILPRLPPCQIPGAARAQSLERLRAGSSMCASWVRRPPVSSRLPERPPPGPAIEPETHACGTPPPSVPYRERWYEGERRRSSVPRAGPAAASPEALRAAGPEGRSRCVMKCHEMSCFVMIRPAHPSRNLLRKPPQGGEAARWINWSGLPRPDRFMPAPQGFLSNARIEHKGNMREFQLLRRDFFVPPTPALPHKRRRGNLEAAARRIALPSGSPSHLAPPSGRGWGRASLGLAWAWTGWPPDRYWRAVPAASMPFGRACCRRRRFRPSRRVPARACFPEPAGNESARGRWS